MSFDKNKNIKLAMQITKKEMLSGNKEEAGAGMLAAQQNAAIKTTNAGR